MYCARRYSTQEAHQKHCTLIPQHQNLKFKLCNYNMINYIKRYKN